LQELEGKTHNNSHLIYDVVIMAVAQGFTAGCPSCHQPTKW